MSKILTPARVTAGATWLTGLGSLIVGGLGVFPAHWQNTAVMIGGLLTQSGSAIKFLDGNKAWETTQANISADRSMYLQHVAVPAASPMGGEPLTLDEKALEAEPVVAPAVLAAEDLAPAVAPEPVPSKLEVGDEVLAALNALMDRLDRAGIAR